MADARLSRGDVVDYLTITPLIALVRRCQLWWFAAYVWLVGGAVLIMGVE